MTIGLKTKYRANKTESARTDIPNTIWHKEEDDVLSAILPIGVERRYPDRLAHFLQANDSDRYRDGLTSALYYIEVCSGTTKLKSRRGSAGTWRLNVAWHVASIDDILSHFT